MKRLAAVAAIGVALALSACNVVVTPDGSPYTYADTAPGVVTVTASPTSGGNEREFFYSSGSPYEADSTVCATFASGQDVDQQGIVLRLNDTVMAGGVQDVTAITVTRNVWADMFDAFNFHVWDTVADPTTPYTQFGQTVIPGLPIGPGMDYYPLNICAQTVTATNTVQFVVWLASQPQPPWGSTTQGGSATIPASAPAAGRGGWFAGHMTAGTSMTYAGLSVDGETPVDPA